ncbi:hypothetical protein FB45DRAFT_1104077 [Roridomyces roridus]|uniref:F-box domain-containing protein n=1 Tax=Roridomyces roridus TaxID=1738132 RepID=A0AAD7F8C8_9AGAR|nr:hypothetical protein FB45DRAFT_1104077 [Roridomyces roridus]
MVPVHFIPQRASAELSWNRNLFSVLGETGTIQDIDNILEGIQSVLSTRCAQSPPRWRNLLRLRGRHPEHPPTPADQGSSIISLAKAAASGRKIRSFKGSELLVLQRALRGRRNDLVSIPRLPTELLMQVLEFCPTIDGESDDRPFLTRGEFLISLNAAHVCQRWRDAALANPRFWSHIVLSHSRWTWELLSRSGNSPLTIGASLCTPDPSYDLVFGQHLSRTRELHLNASWDVVFPSALLDNPAPILDTLHLSTYDEARWPIIDLATFTEELFRGKAPSLRHMVLRHCCLERESPLWNRLTTLEIFEVSKSMLPSRFLAFVAERMPHLRTLTLRETFPDVLAEQELVPLPFLEMLEIASSSSWFCADLLRRVVLSSQCRLILHNYRKNGARDLQISTLKFADCTRTSDTFEVSFDYHLSSMPSTPPCYSVFVTMKFHSDADWRTTIMDAVMTDTDPSLSSVHTLIVESTLTWSASMSFGDSIRTIILHTHITQFALHTKDKPLCFPRLRCLALHDIVVGEQDGCTLVRWLIRRSNLGLRLEETYYTA